MARPSRLDEVRTAAALRLRWTPEAVDDLARLHDFLVGRSPDAARRVVQTLHEAAGRLAVHPRLGSRLDGFGDDEVRRLLVGDYEMRYRLTADAAQILRFFHTREHR